MLKLLLKPSKSLVIARQQRLYQRESLTNQMCIYIPVELNDYDTTKFTVAFKWINSGNVAHAEILESVDSDKENYLKFVLPADTKFTKLAGDNTVKITMVWQNEEDGRTYTIESSELVVPILAQNDYFAYTASSDFSSIDQKIAALQTETHQLAAITSDLPDSLPTDIELNEQRLQLVNENGKLLGDGVEISTGVDDLDSSGDGIIDLTDADDDATTSSPAARAVDLKLSDDLLQLVTDTGRAMGKGVKVTVTGDDPDNQNDGMVDLSDAKDEPYSDDDDLNEDPDGLLDGMINLGAL